MLFRAGGFEGALNTSLPQLQPIALQYKASSAGLRRCLADIGLGADQRRGCGLEHETNVAHMPKAAKNLWPP